MIEQVGFYETRGGKLRYAVGRIPDGTTSSCQWAVCDSGCDIYSCMSSGHFYADRTEDKDDLIRYLPTVKSWNDPIPPPDLPTVTVYTEWLCVDMLKSPSTKWAHDDFKPTTAVMKLRTIEVPANG